MRSPIPFNNIYCEHCGKKLDYKYGSIAWQGKRMVKEIFEKADKQQRRTATDGGGNG